MKIKWKSTEFCNRFQCLRYIRKNTTFFRCFSNKLKWTVWIIQLGQGHKWEGYIILKSYVIGCDIYTVHKVRFSKKSLWSNIDEIKKMSVNFFKKSVLTPWNVREKSNAMFLLIYYKTLPKHRHWRLDATK